MGCDGGTIPRRDELVKTKKKPEQVGRDYEDAARWRTCALTQQKLVKPIVACKLGKIFNKEAIIEAILNKTLAKNIDHIKTMKDVVELTLTMNPSFHEDADKGDTFKDMNISQFICPVVGVEMNGKHRFVVYWKCGCVVSEKAFKEVKSQQCHKCGCDYDLEDIVVLYPNDEELQICKDKLVMQRAIEKERRLAKKIAKREESSKLGGGNEASTSTFKRPHKLPVKKEVVAKKPRSVQDDPSASQVYKDLFTSSSEAKKHDVNKANWVTFNPLYY